MFDPFHVPFLLKRASEWNYQQYIYIASMSGVVLGGVVEVVGSNLATGKKFTASIGSVDSLYPSVFIYCLNLHQFLILCSSKAMMFVKLYFRTSDIYLISLVSLDPSGFHLRTKQMPCIEKEPIYDMYCIRRCQYQRFLNILFWGCLSGAVGSVNVWCSARRCCRGPGFESR